MKLLKDREERRLQVSFRVGVETWTRLREVAKVFGMKENQYAKAVLMKDLEVLNEPLDRRRLPWRITHRKARDSTAERDEET